ncbi:protein TFG-like [Gigantopelta aegis]|uniref:protein TFG-like n=1 Tax=Gigantopelta aegis TaxID=1735272 RepID=UPI001B88D869|nr:protein TFG-like [Gigantopelta aegis]
MQNSYDPQLDLTGKLIIKVQLGDDIRRIPIHNEDITYDELVLMMQRVYRGKLTSSDDITIKYKDEDGDLVTIFDSSDLSFAIQCSRILKITLFVNGEPKPLENDQLKVISKELKQIRNTVNTLLDHLETVYDVTASTTDVNESSITTQVNLKVAGISKPTNMAGNKEFDPLSTQRSLDESAPSKVMSAFGITNDAPDRAATPDSTSSAGSSASNLFKQQQMQQQQQQQQPSAPQHQPAGPQSTPVQPTALPPHQQQYLQQQVGHQQTPMSVQSGSPGTFAAVQGQQQQQPVAYNQAGQGGFPNQPQSGQAQPQPGQPPQASQSGLPQMPQPQLGGLPQSGQPIPQSGQQIPQHTPSQYGYSQQQQPMYQQPQQTAQRFPNPGTPPTQAGPNPYSRGPGTGGYTAGYPRPSGTYPPSQGQAYQ